MPLQVPEFDRQNIAININEIDIQITKLKLWAIGKDKRVTDQIERTIDRLKLAKEESQKLVELLGA
jgi:hypothetical protein